MSSHRVSVIIVNYKAADLIISNLPALMAELEGFGAAEVIVVDNDSPGEDRKLLAEAAATEPRVRLVLAERNGGFAYGNNRGLEAATDTDLIFFLNPDARPLEGSLARLAKTVFEDPSTGVVGPLLINSAGEERASAFARSTVLREFFSAAGMQAKRVGLNSDRVIPVTKGTVVDAAWIPGAAMMVRREVFDRVGGMDEGYFLYFEETDWMESIRAAGFNVICDARAVVEHIEGQSTGIVSGAGQVQALPVYWYESWYRFWSKNRSYTTALAAGMAFAAGLAVKKIRGRSNHRQATLAAFMKYCVVPLLVGGKR